MPVLLTISTTHRPPTSRRPISATCCTSTPTGCRSSASRSAPPRSSTPRPPTSGARPRCVLEVDPIRLARSRRKDAPDFSLSQYVNDRPYAASSLLGVALADVFSTARAGRCVSRQELADGPLPLDPRRSRSCPAAAGPEIAHRLFEPLGWTVEATPVPARPGLPRVGRLPLRGAHAHRRRPAGRRAQPAARAAAGARRVQALLAGRRRGRQAAPLRRAAGWPTTPSRP